MKLVEFKEITGKIILRTGLHIGGGDTEMKIGGTDNPVIKHPYSQEPYIPGSSLKGKVRSLLEIGKEKEDCEKILKLFGASGADQDAGNTLGPTRASFADCPLEKGWKEKVLKEHWSYTEVKSENSINRIMGTAENSRFTERVPADTVFEFSITLKQLGLDEKLEEFLLEGLKLLQMDSLGGSGSRGYGRVEFEFDDNDITKKFETTSPL